MKRKRAGPRRQKESRRTGDREIILLLAAILNFLTAMANLIRELLKR